MISSVLALIAAVAGGQSDPSRASREAFTNCLRSYVDRSLEDRMEADNFNAEYPRQCAAQESAYREAVLRGYRGSRADAEELAGLEIEDARTSFRELFDMSTEDTARRQREIDEAAAAAQAAQQPAATAASGESPGPGTPAGGRGEQPPTR